ncbi:MAG: PUA domain-containing protein, partial [Actinomycetes bacterium]
DKNATLIEEVAEIDGALEALASGPGSEVGSGGMASKLAAARMATWSGVSVTIAEANLPDVIAGALRGEAVGTRFLAREATMPARKLWIAFALPARGILSIDEGAASALEHSGSPLLGLGLSAVSGSFVSGEAVEIRGPSGEILAKGLSAASSEDIAAALAAEPSVLGTVVHRDDLVVLAGFSH